MWCYIILGDNKGSIPNILQLDTITPGYFLLSYTLVIMKRENPELILIFKRIEWSKFIDYFG